MQALAGILAVTFPFFALVLCGYLAARSRLLPLDAVPGLNMFVLYFALPCMLWRFGSTTPVGQLFDPAIAAVWLMAAALIIAAAVWLARRRGAGWPDAAMGALVAAFPNSGFMGVPLILALLGASAVGPVMATLLVDLVLTVDAPTSGIRDRERRAQFRLPPGIGPVNLAGLQPAPAPQLQPGQSALFDGLLHQAPTWDDIAWLRSITRLPVLLKGVLHPADAIQAVAAGAAGVIVSNHGGRTLDTAPPTAVALPRVAQAVAGAVPVLVDGGIRRGTDVLKAMALGASAVLVGRPAIWGLANAGAAGVAHVLRLLRDELEIAMALTGCATLADASQALLNADLPQGGDL